ncbi:8-amino-7-oxononanoate synthase [Dokdonia sinensis]|uniref:8-amino-7-oxononanoate synthase n=2 Tax=Dokdonia sinensis TaxID=2479847 RepID=A0A3M0FUJ6_9FLAO|nr:8-amino-7-oxononanoate synthase [Dokdonia sinensis]RMB56460.1 8-amino-7-oxononanoate synthase [Dokdonia sinensis]
MLPHKLQHKLQQRTEDNSLRELTEPSGLIDFSSNDYLGFSSDSVTSTALSTSFAKAISKKTQDILHKNGLSSNGATGSRLLTGNHKLYALAESAIASFHESEAALIFNSGYDANIGFFQSVPQRGDLIIYDEYIHASIRDGIQMSLARGYKFKHNDVAHLDTTISRLREMHHLNDTATNAEIYVVTESVFSMDGDTPDLKTIIEICKKHRVHLIVDEAHAVGVMGESGEGVVQSLGLQGDVFARVVTFGKALGAHGAAILGSEELKGYLVNFARSLIYTTALPPHSVATIMAGYEQLVASAEGAKQSAAIQNQVESKAKQPAAIKKLQTLINHFNTQLRTQNLTSHFIPSTSAIHCAVIQDVEKVKALSQELEKQGFNVKPILSPTVPKGQERLRICLHAFNTEEEIERLLSIIKEHI